MTLYRPGALPVQAPTKVRACNQPQETAKALGLDVPDVVPLRANDVIE
jgi:hypothetical protein